MPISSWATAPPCTDVTSTVAGPTALTLSTAVMVATMGVLYAELFHIKLHDFLPFIALSIVLWNFMSSLVTDGCVAFTSSEGGTFTLDPITTVKLTGTAGNFTAGQSYSFLVGTVPTGSTGAVTNAGNFDTSNFTPSYTPPTNPST